jgi:diamine N-acetyltransferase
MSAEPTVGSVVTLREINAETVRGVCTLWVREDQKRFVAPNAISIAQAHFAPEAWFRAIYAGETPVGFAMISDKPEVPEYFLWRFMIDQRWQHLGLGRRAIELLIAHVRVRPGAQQFLTSAVPGEGSPQGFYEKLGFVPTGAVEDGEVVLALDLAR